MGRRRVLRRREREKPRDSEFSLMKARLQRGEITRAEWLAYLRERKQKLAKAGVTVKGGRVPIEEKYNIPKEILWERYLRYDGDMKAIAQSITDWIIRNRSDVLPKKEIQKLRAKGISARTIRRVYDERIGKPPEGFSPYKTKITFEETDLSKKIKEYYFMGYDKQRRPKLTRRGREIYNLAKKLMEDYFKKPPEQWTKKDFQEIYKHPDFIDPMTGKCQFNKGSQLRMIMELLGHKDWTTERWADSKHGAPKRPKGRKLTHYINDEQTYRVIDCISDLDTLVYAKIQMECGARFSAMRRIRPSDIDDKLNIINFYEPKVQKPVPRYFQPETIQILKDYIRYRGIKSDERIFQHEMSYYNKHLREAGKKAGLPFKLTTHILKHTFVSQAGYHLVPMQIVSAQSGTDPNTLKEFYAGLEQKAFQHYIQGIKIDIKPYDEWLKELQPIWRYRYDYLKSLEQRR